MQPMPQQHAGAQRRERPERYGPSKMAHHRRTVWRRDGTLGRLLERRPLRLDERGRIDHEVWCVDATQVRPRA